MTQPEAPGSLPSEPAPGFSDPFPKFAELHVDLERNDDDGLTCIVCGRDKCLWCFTHRTNGARITSGVCRGCATREHQYARPAPTSEPAERERIEKRKRELGEQAAAPSLHTWTPEAMQSVMVKHDQSGAFKPEAAAPEHPKRSREWIVAKILVPRSTLEQCEYWLEHNPDQQGATLLRDPTLPAATPPVGGAPDVERALGLLRKAREEADDEPSHSVAYRLLDDAVMAALRALDPSGPDHQALVPPRVRA